MKKNPAPVLLDRLSHALARHGVRMRRQQLLETAAYAFACRSSDEFSAALKAGELETPPVTAVGRVSLPDGTTVIIVTDPQASSHYGIDESFVETVVDGERRERIGVTPYGHLVDLLPLLDATIPTIEIGRTADVAHDDESMKDCIAIIEDAIREIDGYTAEDHESDDVGQAENALTRAIESARAGSINDVHGNLSSALESLALVRNDDVEQRVHWTRDAVRKAQRTVPTSTTRTATPSGTQDSRLHPYLMMALQQIDQEIESRRQGMDAAAWSELSRIADIGHAAARGVAPEPFGDDDDTAIRISRKDLNLLLDAARTQADDVSSGIEEGLYDEDDNEDAGDLEQAISDVEARLAMPVTRRTVDETQAPGDRTRIFVARMVHKHGSDIRVAASQKDLDAQIADFCRENWDEIVGQEDVPSSVEGMSDLDIGTMYYDRVAMISDDFVEETIFHVPTAQLLPGEANDRRRPDAGRTASRGDAPDPHRMIPITGTDGEETCNVDVETMAALCLPFHREGEQTHPLTEKEQLFASPHVRLNGHLDLPVDLGTTVLFGGRKWLAPSIEFAWDPMQEGFVDDADAARERMLKHVEHLEPMITALGGSIRTELGTTDLSHEMTVLLPFGVAYESESVEDWNAALAYLLSTDEEKKTRPGVTCEFTAEKDYGRSVFSVEPLGDTIWDGTFDALRWGTREAIAILTDEKDADDYARSPMAPAWVQEWTTMHPFEVDPIGLQEALRIAL